MSRVSLSGPCGHVLNLHADLLAIQGVFVWGRLAAVDTVSIAAADGDVKQDQLAAFGQGLPDLLAASKIRWANAPGLLPVDVEVEALLLPVLVKMIDLGRDCVPLAPRKRHLSGDSDAVKLVTMVQIPPVAWGMPL